MYEPDGGNLYRPHHMLAAPGLYWRCKHGRTGITSHLRWVGCWRCWVMLERHQAQLGVLAALIVILVLECATWNT